MTLTFIAIACTAALVYNRLVPDRWRGWMLMGASIVAIYALQPFTAIRQLDFVLPTFTLVLTIACWLFTRAAGPFAQDDYAALLFTVVLVLAVSATRYLVPELRLTSRPPETPLVALALILTAGGIVLLWRTPYLAHDRLSIAMLMLIALLVMIKYEPLTIGLSSVLRSWRGQDVTLAASTDWSWLGFSYVAFRLIHTLRDRQTGQLPPVSLREYVTYVIFFPAYTAGPIDRAERFAIDYRALPALTAARLTEGLGRIVVGIMKKFVLADTLALLSLDATRAAQVTSAGGLWLLLYVYAFRLFFDFSGYTDIAIGIGILYGVQLPENFDRPYLRNNIAAFWQSWHMTLSGWVRFYIFSPLSRWLLSKPKRPPLILILLIGHLTTMIVIGLWHGISGPFVLWGAWHGLGLFVHKVWSDRTRKAYLRLRQRPRLRQAWTVLGVALTFHFVLLGWVWFALPDLESALSVFRRLFGL
ncbi:MAG: hypothetical protein K8J31_09965 [Anaerolineae bacterium]|nr:hypothetical protein [Anaerolineae bacterium]